MTEKDFPPRLQGPRIEPDRPQVRIEINCICGGILEAATYLDNGIVKLVVAPCKCAGRGLA